MEEDLGLCNLEGGMGGQIHPLKEVLVVYLPCATKRALMEECGVLFSQPRIRGDMLWCFDSFLQKSLMKV